MCKELREGKLSQVEQDCSSGPRKCKYKENTAGKRVQWDIVDIEELVREG